VIVFKEEKLYLCSFATIMHTIAEKQACTLENMVQVAVKLFGMHSYNCGWHIS
jgi:hypothetical protein